MFPLQLWGILAVTIFMMGRCLTSVHGCKSRLGSPSCTNLGTLRSKASLGPQGQSCWERLKKRQFGHSMEAVKIVFGTPPSKLKEALTEHVSHKHLSRILRICWNDLSEDSDRAFQLKIHPIMIKPKTIQELVNSLGEEGAVYSRWIQHYYRAKVFDPNIDPRYSFHVSNFRSDGTLGPLEKLIQTIHREILDGDMHPEIPVALPSPLPEASDPQFIALKSLIALCTGKPSPNTSSTPFSRDVMFAYLELVYLTTSHARSEKDAVIWLRPSIMKEDKFPVTSLPDKAKVMLVMPNDKSNTWEMVILERLKDRRPLIRHISLREGVAKGFESTLDRIKEKLRKTLRGRRIPRSSPLLSLDPIKASKSLDSEDQDIEVTSEVSPFAVKQATHTAGALLYHAKMVFLGYNPTSEVSRIFVHTMSDLCTVVASELLTGRVFLPECLSSDFRRTNGYLILEKIDEEFEAGAESGEASHAGGEDEDKDELGSRGATIGDLGNRKRSSAQPKKDAVRPKPASPGAPASAQKSPSIRSTKGRSNTAFKKGKLVKYKKKAQQRQPSKLSRKGRKGDPSRR